MIQPKHTRIPKQQQQIAERQQKKTMIKNKLMALKQTSKLHNKLIYVTWVHRGLKCISFLPVRIGNCLDMNNGQWLIVVNYTRIMCEIAYINWVMHLQYFATNYYYIRKCVQCHVIFTLCPPGFIRAKMWYFHLLLSRKMNVNCKYRTHLVCGVNFDFNVVGALSFFLWCVTESRLFLVSNELNRSLLKIWSERFIVNHVIKPYVHSIQIWNV